MTQRVLPKSAIDEFDTPEGVAEQIQHFKNLLGIDPSVVFSILDVGGGTGFFVSALKSEFRNVDATILDLDQASVTKSVRKGLNSIHGSIVAPPRDLMSRRFDVISFNLVLHHIIAETDSSTVALQQQALRQARVLLKDGGRIFVHEICFEGRFFADLSGLLIYRITSSHHLEKVLRFTGTIFSALKANTVGVGVRFRPLIGWEEIARSVGLEALNTCEGGPEGHSLLRKALLLIKEVRRRSLLLCRDIDQTLLNRR